MRKRSRIRAAVVGGTGALAIAGISATAVGVGGRDEAKPAYGPLPPATAQVARTTLVETQEVDGSLGYGDTSSLTGRAAGTVTWLPAAGERIKRGRPVYRVDDVPVVLLYGSLPLYRALAPDTEGADVRQFEQNLRALGYRGFTVDDRYTANTANAVRKWQRDLGVKQTGTLDITAAVVAPDEIRVTEHKVALGDAAGAGPVLGYTATTQAVTVDLDVKYQRMAKPAARVTVGLPDGREVQGRIASIGAVAKTSADEGPNSRTTVEVVVTVADQKALGGYDKAPVQVRLVADERKDVLAVPVAALLALAEGGYGVQVVEGGSTRIVRVDVGMFAMGQVEVRGDGITAGTTVGVPA